MTSMQRTPPRTYWSLGLSPAQSWIAEARRSRDLLAGSRLLAWLMGRLLVHLKAEGASVRLPELEPGDLASLDGGFAKALGPDAGSVTNHASGWVELPLEEAENLFGGLETKLDSWWRDLRSEVARDAGSSAPELWALLEPEVGEPSCPLQLAWALREAGPEVPEGLAQVEAVFAAVKRSRPIPVHSGLPVRKCGQCGRREAVGGEDPASWRAFQDRLSEVPEVQKGLRIDDAEYLCSVCALRRFAGYLTKEAFPSTSAVAAEEWLWRIRKSQDLRAALSALESAMAKVPGYTEKWADRAPLYFQRSLARELRQARNRKDAEAETKLQAVRTERGKLDEAIRRHNRNEADNRVPENPPEYLAVLMFDGDDMGRRLREDLENLPRQVVAFQKRLAGWLKESGESVPPRGQPFYLGGDEGLILVPAAEALDVAHGVQEIWNQTAGSTKAKATLSMGIALFDRERPLGSALDAARRSLEQVAKAMEAPMGNRKKDALAVTVQTASGSEWTAVAHWGESWNRVREAVRLIRKRTLSSGWPYDVERFLRTLPERAFQEGGETRDAIREEVKRITGRRCPRAKDRDVTWKNLEGDSWWKGQPADEEIRSLPDHLHLVAFLAREAGAL